MSNHQTTPVYQILLTSEVACWVFALMLLLKHYEEGIERASEPEQQPLSYLASQPQVVTRYAKVRCFRSYINLYSI